MNFKTLFLTNQETKLFLFMDYQKRTHTELVTICENLEMQLEEANDDKSEMLTELSGKQHELNKLKYNIPIGTM